MRTTLTLDPDVAAGLDRLRRQQGHTLKKAVNEAIRAGLRSLEDGAPPRSAFSTRPVSLGGCLIGSLHDVAESLAVAEGEDFR